MNPFQSFLRSLNAEGVEFVVVGGHAVMFHGYPRSTDDLDILFVQTQINASRLARAVRPFVSTTRDDDFLGPADEFIIVRTGGIRIDLLPEISGVSTAEVIASAVSAELFGEPARFISKTLLLRNKRSTSRLKDLADAEELEGPEE